MSNVPPPKPGQSVMPPTGGAQPPGNQQPPYNSNPYQYPGQPPPPQNAYPGQQQPIYGYGQPQPLVVGTVIGQSPSPPGQGGSPYPVYPQQMQSSPDEQRARSSSQKIQVSRQEVEYFAQMFNVDQTVVKDVMKQTGADRDKMIGALERMSSKAPPPKPAHQSQYYFPSNASKTQFVDLFDRNDAEKRASSIGSDAPIPEPLRFGTMATVRRLQEVFPQVQQQKIINVLNRNQGDAREAAQSLMSMAEDSPVKTNLGSVYPGGSERSERVPPPGVSVYSPQPHYGGGAPNYNATHPQGPNYNATPNYSTGQYHQGEVPRQSTEDDLQEAIRKIEEMSRSEGDKKISRLRQQFPNHSLDSIMNAISLTDTEEQTVLYLKNVAPAPSMAPPGTQPLQTGVKHSPIPGVQRTNQQDQMNAELMRKLQHRVPVQSHPASFDALTEPPLQPSGPTEHWSIIARKKEVEKEQQKQATTNIDQMKTTPVPNVQGMRDESAIQAFFNEGGTRGHLPSAPNVASSVSNRMQAPSNTLLPMPPEMTGAPVVSQAQQEAAKQRPAVPQGLPPPPPPPQGASPVPKPPQGLPPPNPPQGLPPPNPPQGKELPKAMPPSAQLPPPPPLPKLSGGPPPPPLPKGVDFANVVNQARAAAKTKAVFWQKVASDVDGTIWGQDNDLLENSLFEDEEKGVLEEIFAKKAVEERKKGGGDSKAPKQILDASREKNIGIVLQFIRLPVAIIKKSVETFDELTINQDILSGLISIIPTPEDQKAIAPYINANTAGQSTLSPPVHYLIMTTTIDRYAQRLNCWMAKLEFPDFIDDIEKRMAIVHDATKALNSSNYFPQLLVIILKVGNILNEGTQFQDAKGFKMSDLDKICCMKTSDNKGTMLNYIVTLVDKKKPEIHGFSQEFAPVHAASPIDLGMIQADLKDLTVRVGQCAGLIKAQSSDPRVMDAIGGFVAAAQPRIQQLQTKFDAIKESADALAGYFAENTASFKPQELFKHISKFTREYEANWRKIEEQKERQQRMLARSQEETTRPQTTITAPTMGREAADIDQFPPRPSTQPGGPRDPEQKRKMEEFESSL